MKFSEKLQKLRKEHNLSQEGLADKLDVSRQSVSKWESGQTYPEMDKLLTMCKLFNVTLDDLTNDEVKYNEVKSKSNKTFDNLVDDVMYIIDKSFNMFNNMNNKEKGKCIGELIILLFILLLFRLPFNYILSLGLDVIYTFPRGVYFFSSVWTFMINIVYLILFIFTYIYIYKTYYLDRYKPNEEKNKEVKNEEVHEKEVELKEEIIKPNKKEEKVKEKRSYRGIGSTLFETLGRVISICFKIFLTFLSIPFIISFIALFIALFIMITLIINKIYYFGFLICIIAAIVLNGLLLKLIMAFLFSYKPKFNLMFGTFLLGLILTGIGTGLAIFDVASTEISDEMPKTNMEYVTKTIEYDTSKNILFDPYSCCYDVEYIADETLIDTVKIEISYFEEINYIEVDETYYNNYTIITPWSNEKYSREILNTILDNLKDKEIYNYGLLYEYKIKVYTSTYNIEKIKENESNYYKENWME